MRYIMIIPDGASGSPCPSLNNKTSFAVAHKPNLDKLAQEGFTGLCKTIPDGCEPGSDIAGLSLLGYDPRSGYTGRAALEAAAQNLNIPENDAVFRVNLVSINNNIMQDHSAGHISDADAREIISQLQKDLNIPGVSLHHGVSYRHLCIIKDAAKSIPKCTPPHNIIGQDIASYRPTSGIFEKLLEVENKSKELLKNYPINKRRSESQQPLVSQLWFWAGATKMSLPNFTDKFKIKGSMISAVDLLRGIANLAGLQVINVPGATGYYDTNYQGKGEAALKAIEKDDIVIVHIEAPDEAGHNGDPSAKVKSIEDIDKHIIGPIYSEAKKHNDWRILVTPDHPTPLITRKHSSDPVPFVIWGEGFYQKNPVSLFSEENVISTQPQIIIGKDLLATLLKK